jgi:hypothetical protein
MRVPGPAVRRWAAVVAPVVVAGASVSGVVGAVPAVAAQPPADPAPIVSGLVGTGGQVRIGWVDQSVREDAF